MYDVIIEVYPLNEMEPIIFHKNFNSIIDGEIINTFIDTCLQKVKENGINNFTYTIR